MAEEKQMPLNELLFGPKPERTAEAVPSLAKVIAVWCRYALARSRRGQAARSSSLPQPPGEPKR
jgi:hypothetical protein